MLRGGSLLAALVALVLATAAAHPAPAQEPAAAVETETPTLISADEVIHDQNLGVITARGNVEISHEERILLADTVSYNTRTRVVSASGNVSLLQANGDVIFGDFFEVTDDMREGFIRNVRVLLSDQSRMAAANGLLSAGDRTVYRRAVYSPCELCREDPTRAPLWQLKAEKVVHDQDDQRIRYRNAWLEMFGVPALYTPYISHPDPTADRASGFLSPTFGISETFGGVAQFSYYWAISPTMDATIEPIFTTKQGVVMAGEFRQLLPFGTHQFDGSGTFADREEKDGTISKDVLRGHIFSKGRYEINNTWRTGFDFDRTTDDTYLRLYKFNRDRLLTSRLYAEGFGGRSYAAANSFLFQGLRDRDINREQPVVLPMFDYNYVSEPLIADSRITLDSNIAVLTRVEGRDTRRLSLKSAWELPFVDPIGGIYTLSTVLQTDGYWTKDFQPGNPDPNPNGPTENELAGRIFPQAALQWRYPLVSYGEGYDQIVQPIAQLVVGLNGGNPDEIPNEDSLDFEFDDTNLFSLNRFPGLDRVDSGQRIDYGLLWEGRADYGGSASTFFGQSFRRQSEQKLFPTNSGVQDKLSDVVGRVSLQPYRYIDLLYRFRLDKDNFDPWRHEVDLNLGPPALNLDLTYLFDHSETPALDDDDREQIRLRLNSQFSRYWRGYVSTRRDLQLNDTLSGAVGVRYEDECFIFSIAGKRAFYVDRDIQNEDSIFLQVSFKNLGGVATTQKVRGGPQ